MIPSHTLYREYIKVQNYNILYDTPIPCVYNLYTFVLCNLFIVQL